MTDDSLLLPTLLRVPVEVSQHCVLVPALWSTEVQDWEIDCMNGLVLEESNDGNRQEAKENNPFIPQANAGEESKVTDGLAQTSAADVKKPVKKEAGGGAKSVFARMLKVARRYLGEVGRGQSAESKPSPQKSHLAGGHSSQARPSSTSLTRTQMRSRKKSQKGTLQRSAGGRGRRTALPSQDSDGGVTDAGPEPALKRRGSGPVGRVARRRSSCRPIRGKSLHALRPKPGHGPAPTGDAHESPGAPPVREPSPQYYMADNPNYIPDNVRESQLI
ncbi:hypothetical protein GJAV_G00228730 [Gymnothorax javanicus]|nr:hypothetical protein GJAV_G00228730 [Gymnothorax javanicus]